jgi:uncharacterized protein YecE (DUF72 family)
VAAASRAGILRTGTSGFAYAAWTPRFYPPGTRPEHRLASYAGRLSACELNGTFYRRPSREQLRRWREAVGPGFRFIVKAQRGASLRAIRGDASGPVAWVTEALDELGDSLGGVLFRVPADIRRDDDRLGALLAAWPRSIPLVVELQDSSWHVEETFAALRGAGAVLCATEGDEAPAPDLRVTGPFLYVRLRRSMYDAGAIEIWAARHAPFLAAGLDAYAFLRHDEDGTSALTAEALEAAIEARLRPAPAAG